MAHSYTPNSAIFRYEVDSIAYVENLLTNFEVAFTATAIFNTNSTLMIDLYPSKPASATAIVCDQMIFAKPNRD